MISDCGLGIADWGLRIGDCGLGKKGMRHEASGLS
jgi:hypothetical protein